MTELEKMKRARMYIEKLANGINPIDDTAVPEEDIVNNVHLSRCFFFVSDVLRQVIEHRESASAANTKKPQKLPFFLPYEKRGSFAFSKFPIPASEIVKRLNDLIDSETMKKMSYAMIVSWLLEVGMLTLIDLPSGKQAKRPTLEGQNLGITNEDRMGAKGAYQVVVYDLQAQHFIIDNLDAILESTCAKTEMQGKPWIPVHDDCLRDLYQKGVPLSEIAVTLKRNTGAIQARLKKLGLVRNSLDA